MIRVHNIKLDIVKENLKPKIFITQNDLKADKIVVEVLKNDKYFKLDGLEPMIVCLKPSGKYTLNPMEIVNNRLEFTLTRQEVIEPGKVEFQVLLYGVDGERFSAMKFEINILNELVNTSLIESEISVEPLLNYLVRVIDELKLEVSSLDVVGINNRLDEINFSFEGMKSELLNKRDKSVLIEELDLSLFVREKLNKEYDDSFLKNKLEILESLLSKKRDSDVLINELDLSLDLIEKINREIKNYDDSELRNRVGSLEIDMTTKRDKGSKIGELDLTLELLEKINKGATYDDTLIKKEISDLSLLISSKRDKSVKISSLDLDESINSKLDNIVPPYDDTLLKNRVIAVEGALPNKRDKTVKITELDLSPEVVAKLNVVTEGYDDAEVRGLISNLQMNKRDKSDKVLESELSVELQQKVNQVGLEGKSAYEVAVENGFIGTKAEWLLTLKGPAGEKGDRGLTGATGPKGDRGDPGIQGLKGDPGIMEDENKVSGVREVKIWTGTQTEYDLVSPKRDDVLYFVR